MNWLPAWPTDGGALRPGYPIPPPGFYPYYHPGMMAHAQFAPPQVQPTPNGQPAEAPNAEVTQTPAATQSAAPVIDPSLDSASAVSPPKPTSSKPSGSTGANATDNAQQQLDATTQLQITHAAMQAVFDAARRHQEKLDAEQAEEQATQLFNTVAATAAADAATHQPSAPPPPGPTAAPNNVESSSSTTQSVAAAGDTSLPASADAKKQDETSSASGPAVTTATPSTGDAKVGQALGEAESAAENASS